MAFADPDDVAGYLHIDAAELPDDVARLLDRAHEVIDEAVLAPIGEPADWSDDRADAIKQAVCAQIEYWIEAGESPDVEGNIQSYQLGDLQVAFGAAGNREAPRILATRARRHLATAGLLARGAVIG